jgi:hypothetical protein
MSYDIVPWDQASSAGFDEAVLLAENETFVEQFTASRLSG